MCNAHVLHVSTGCTTDPFGLSVQNVTMLFEHLLLSDTVIRSTVCLLENTHFNLIKLDLKNMHNNIYLRVINQAIVNLSYIYKNKPTHILLHRQICFSFFLLEMAFITGFITTIILGKKSHFVIAAGV